MLNDIKWKEGAVCFADGTQFKDWDVNRGELITVDNVSILDFETALSFKDFQPNTIKQGDYIEASELDTEQKYNDLADIVKLVGFRMFSGGDYDSMRKYGGLVFDSDGDVVDCPEGNRHVKRKITFNQLIAIGELKRFEVKRSAPKTAPDLTPDLTPDLASNQEIKMQKNKPVVAQVMIDLTERMEIGIKTYGEALRANNGRNALQDAYEEALDLACYLKQAMIERDSKEVK